MMPTPFKLPTHLAVVPKTNGLVADKTNDLVEDDHADHAAKRIVDLLNLWKLSVTEEMPSESIARTGFNMVMARLVELRVLARGARPTGVS